MASTKEIFNGISIFYYGIELNRITALKDYGDFLCDVLDSDKRHTAALALHTGSEYYQAIAVAVSAISCLFYRNTDTADLIESLEAGEILMLDGQRVKFLGIKTGLQLHMGSPSTKYFIYEFDDHGSTKYTMLENALKMNITRYQGNSIKLGKQGIKTTLKARKDFLSAFSDTGKKTETSTEINHSVAIITDRNTAERLYRGIQFAYGGKKDSLSEIVTATYYSDEECYQIGNNPTKEEPILKFFSKVSSCRDIIMDDSQKRIIGCVVGDEDLWVSNSEIHDIVDRKSLKFAIMSGKTHYTQYKSWYESDEYICYAAVPETVQHLLNEAEFSLWTQDIKKELVYFQKRSIVEHDISSNAERDVVYEIKKRLLKIKKECIDGDAKENFLMESYFLLNLCRSAFFPLSYCDKANEKKFLNWTIAEKIENIKSFISMQIGELKEDAKFVLDNISQMVAELYHANPKGEAIKSGIISRKVDCIVVTKAYYERLFLMWLEDCKLNICPNIVTVSAFEKNINIWGNVVFSTAYYDFSFNPYASFGFVSADALIYDYEKYQAHSLKRAAEDGRKLLKERNTYSYDIVVEAEEIETVVENVDDEKFESEMDKMAKELLLKGAYRYISAPGAMGESIAKIEKIFTFASGSVGYFTKRYKGYRICGEEVVETGLDELKVGNSMVFTKQSENKDIVDLLLNQLLEEQYKNTKYPEYYRLSLCWKEKLKEYMSEYELTYQQLAENLSRVGCKRHYTTVRSWLEEGSLIVGPRDLSDYEAMIRLVDLGEFPADIKKGCDKIRSLRMRILDLLGKAILRGLFADKKDPISELIYQKAENLTQIEQITSITNSGANAGVPFYMINKPCNT